MFLPLGIDAGQSRTPTQSQKPAAHVVKLDPGYGKLPLSFEANVGQTAKEVQFLSRAPGGTIYLTPEEAVFVIPNQRNATVPGAPDKFKLRKLESIASRPRRRSVVRMKLQGANPHSRATALQKLPGIANYFIGNDPTKWHTKIPTYRQVQYRDIYPGIDLTYYGNQRQLEYDFVVKPGADPRRIAMTVEGADGIRLDGNGDLLIATASGELRQHKPIVYQEINGMRHEIDSRYVFASPSEVGFDIAAYDSSKEIVIDPVLSYSTFLGGSGGEGANGIAVDKSGNAYVTGETVSADFPTRNAFQDTLAPGPADAFITKIGAAGNALVYSTYLGGRPNPGNGVGGIDAGFAIAVDSNGNAYITGTTSSIDFPVVGGYQTNLKGEGDAFLTKVDASGAALVFSTYLGGSGTFDYATGIAVDNSGSAYLAGNTDSTDFPTVNAAQSTYGGENDTFVTKFNASGNALVFSTYLGGTGGDFSEGNETIAVDSSGSAYVTGHTYSMDFPTVNALQGALHGMGDAFVTKFDVSGNTFIYSTYLGGSGDDPGYAISVDSAGNAYVTGITSSADFPTVNPIQGTLGGIGDNFVTKMNATGSALIYSTYLGGTSGEGASAIAVDALGEAYVAGSTMSTDFPVVNAVQGALSGSEDAFITKLSSDGAAWIYSTYLGGGSVDRGYGIAADTSGNAYITGSTISSDFPTVNPVQSTIGGQGDVFITKISEGGLSLHSPSPSFSPSAVIASSADNVDAALQLVPDENRLKNQPVVVGGLVADGVTPLLIQFDPNPVPEQDTTYTLSMDVSGGSLTMGTLDDKLLVLQQSGSVFQFVPGNSVTVSTSHPTGFAYISGIKSEELMLATENGSKELTVTLKIIKNGDPSPTATITFRIRRPPIVLVHGIKSDNSTWYNEEGTPQGLLGALEVAFPSDFIMPVEYGVDHNSVVPHFANTFDKFVSLAPLLDSALRAQVEDATSLWHQGWAFTRYDVVGHSQGGILLRMLCTDNDPASPQFPNFHQFRTQNNAFRGRFRRVVTLNSPHNGTTLYNYTADLLGQVADFPIPEALEALQLDKFNPFGMNSQIYDINFVHYHVDPLAKLNLVGTTIREGRPPRIGEFLPASYSVPGLTLPVIGQSNSAGQVVIPSGSDGIVDYTSELAGIFDTGRNGRTSVTGFNISHSGPTDFFADSRADFGTIESVTDSAAVGNTVVALLNGPADSFAPFSVAEVDPALEGEIADAVPPIRLLLNLIELLGTARNTANSGTTYQFMLVPPPDNPLQGKPTWYAEVLGPDGVTTDGITVTQGPGTGETVTVEVDDSVFGDVLLHVSYNDTNGNLITGDPIVVVSRPPGTTLTGIELVPNTVSLTVGSNAATQIWGDYDNGTRSQLYVPPDATIAYTSEDPTIATVDAVGNVQLLAVGTTNIDVSYLGFAAQTSVTSSAVPPPPVLAPLQAVSRKVHKTAGNFDINLPLTGDEGIECRSGGRGGKYQMIVTFASPVTVANASVTSGIGGVSNFGVNGLQVTVNLASVTTAQRMTVTLSGVSDGTSTNDVIIPMAILVGDVTGEGVVDAADVDQAKLAIGQPVGVTNFRDDVIVDGRINKRDAQTVQSNIGMQLPP